MNRGSLFGNCLHPDECRGPDGAYREGFFGKSMKKEKVNIVGKGNT